MTLDNRHACITLLGNGTKNYQFDFPFNNVTEIIVETKIDASHGFTTVSNFTVDPVSSALHDPSQVYIAGTIKFDTNISSPTEIRISRIVSVDQPFSFVNTISAPSKETEQALDYLSMVDQQQQCKLDDLDQRVVTAEQVKTAASQAVNSASQAQTYAQSALLAKTAAETAATNAQQSASNSQQSASSILGAVSQAQTAATNAAQSATDANTAFHGAQGILTNVITQSTAATNASTAAQTAATNAATSATNAAHSETLIAQHMTDAQAASHSAQQAATNAQTSATNALAAANRVPDPATGHQDDVITIDNGHYVLKQGGTGGGGGGGGAFIPNPATGNTGDMVVVSGTGTSKTYGLQANPASPATIDVLKLSKSSGIINGCHLTVNSDQHSFKITAGNVLYVSPEVGIPTTIKTYPVAANDNIAFAPTLLPTAKVIYIYVEVDLTTQSTNVVQRNALEKKARGELIFIGFAMNPLLADVEDIVNVNNIVSSNDFNQFSELVFNGAYTTGYALSAANATHFASHNCVFYGAASSRTDSYIATYSEPEHNSYAQTIISGTSPQLFQYIANAKLPGATPRADLIAPYGMEPNGTGAIVEIPANHYFYFFAFVSPSGMLYILLPFESFDSIDKLPSVTDYYYKWQSHFPEPLKTFYAPVSAIIMKQGLSLIDPEIKFISLEKYSGFEAPSASGSSGIPISPSLSNGILSKSGDHITSQTIESLSEIVAHKLPPQIHESFLEADLDRYFPTWGTVLARGIAINPTDDSAADGVGTPGATRHLPLTAFVQKYNDVTSLYNASKPPSGFFNLRPVRQDSTLDYINYSEASRGTLISSYSITANSSANPIVIPIIAGSFSLPSFGVIAVGIDLHVPPTPGGITTAHLHLPFTVTAGRMRVTTEMSSDTPISAQTGMSLLEVGSYLIDYTVTFTSTGSVFYHIGDNDPATTSHKFISILILGRAAANTVVIGAGANITINPSVSTTIITLPTDHVKFLFPYKLSEYNTSATTGNLTKGYNKTNIAVGDVYIFIRFDLKDVKKSPIRGVVKIPSDPGSNFPIVKLETVDKATSVQPVLVAMKPYYGVWKITVTTPLLDYRISVRFVKPVDGYFGEGQPDFTVTAINATHKLKAGVLMVSSIHND